MNSTFWFRQFAWHKITTVARLLVLLASPALAADPIKVVTQRDVAVPMRDGVVLRANVFRPDVSPSDVSPPVNGGPYPVLVLRTPHGKPAGGMDQYVQAGYIVVATGESERWLNFLPWRELPANVCEDETESVQAWLKNPHTDPWKLHEDVKDIEVSNLNLIRWCDHCNGNMLLDRTIRTDGATAAARTGSRTLIGPWAHSKRRAYGNIDFGPEAQIDSFALAIRWFDYWLKGKQNGTDETTSYRIFVMGENRWHDEARWPLKRAQERSFFIASEGNANTPAGNGHLIEQKPKRECSDHYDFALGRLG